jgi:cytochrome c
MKKVFAIVLLSAVIASCGGSGSKKSGADSASASNQTATAAQPNADTNATKIGTESGGATAAIAPGAKLMAASDCNTCHKVDVKVIGPALQDVAAKYPPTASNIETLTNKVIAGGKGNWGDIAMAAHPTLPKADVTEMVKYILSLKK